MIEAIGIVLAALSAIVAVGALIVGYIIWRSNRRMDDAAAEMAKQSSGGGGGPREPA